MIPRAEARRVLELGPRCIGNAAADVRYGLLLQWRVFIRSWSDVLSGILVNPSPNIPSTI